MSMLWLWAGESAVNFRHFLEFEADGIDVLEMMLLEAGTLHWDWNSDWEKTVIVGKTAHV